MNIVVKNAELNSKSNFAFQKRINSLPVHNVIVLTRARNYLPSCRLDRGHLSVIQPVPAVVGPAVGFPEQDKANGRVPFSTSKDCKFKGALWEPQL